MKKIENQHFTGERALFRSQGLEISNCIFDDGESPLKESSDCVLDHVTFGYKYPLWYGKNHVVRDSTFLLMSRSGIWYTRDSKFYNLHIVAPKEFRRCENLFLENIIFDDATETLWTCKGIRMNDIHAKGDYLLKDCSDVEVSHLELDGNYAFDGGRNIHITDSTLNTKDAFWNCENVVIENCRIDGEYFGWNSSNITLRNCVISSHQGFCYMRNLKMENCTIEDGDLLLEYCENIDATIHSNLKSVKNPISGIIRLDGVSEMIRDDERIDLSKIHVLVRKGEIYEEI
jgi:hypothetical protein